MTKENQDFTLYRGTDKIIRVSMTTNGDISGWKLEATIRKAALSSTAILTKKSANNGGASDQLEVTTAGTDTTPGVFLIKLLDTDTEALEPREYIWDAKRMDSGAEDVLSTGVITLKAGPTR